MEHCHTSGHVNSSQQWAAGISDKLHSNTLILLRKKIHSHILTLSLSPLPSTAIATVFLGPPIVQNLSNSINTS